jgi:hypothetical protein
MGTVAASAIRQAVAAKITALGVPYQELARAYDLVQAEPASVLHGGFAVGVPAAADLRDRQRPGVGALTLTRLVVVLFWRATPKDQVTAYDAALDAASTVRVAVCAVSASYPGDCSIRWKAQDVRVTPDPMWYEIRLAFDVQHVAPN